MSRPCPPPEIWNQFVAATLADSQADDLVAHLAVCEACSRKVDELEHRPQQPMLAAFRELKDASTDVPDPPLPPKIGQYEILEKIGQGGMGVVYRAVQPHLERDVAIKVVKESRLTDPAARERFKREVQAVGKLRHPNIVQAHDAGFVDDKPYLVMEFLHGVDLGEHVKRHGKINIDTASDYIRQAALGLQHAHEAGIVHRDVKPSNLFLLRDGTVKILDLGLATLLEAEEQQISWRNIDLDVAKNVGFEGDRSCTHEPGASRPSGYGLIGSLDFLSPEQALGLKTESSSDIYSLGCTFYFLLTGKPPLDGERYSTVPDKLAGHIRDDFPALRIPRKTDTVIRKMVAKTPANRFASAGEVAQALVVRRSFRNAVLAMLIAVTAAITAFAVAKRNDGAEAFFNNGSKHFERDAFPAAIKDFTEAIRRRPTFLEAYNKRAACYEKMSDDRSAVADHTEVIRLQPDRANAYYNRGICLARQGMIDEAMRDFNESIKLDSTSFLSFNNRAEIYRRQGKLEPALKDIEEAMRLQPRHPILFHTRGTIRKEQGDLQGALDDFSEAIHYDPTIALSYNNRGLIYTESGDHPKGLQDLDKAVELDQGNPTIFNNRGLCKLNMKNFEAAIKDFDEAIRLSPSLAMAYNNRGLCKTDLGQLDDAVSDLDQAIELDPDLMLAHHNKGRALLLKQDFAGAVVSLSVSVHGP